MSSLSDDRASSATRNSVRKKGGRKAHGRELCDVFFRVSSFPIVSLFRQGWKKA
jgi:hypothetical protein